MGTNRTVAARQAPAEYIDKPAPRHPGLFEQSAALLTASGLLSTHQGQALIAPSIRCFLGLGLLSPP